jgi:hypothetical protein
MVAITFAGGQPEDVQFKESDSSTPPGQKRPVAQAASETTGTDKQGWAAGYSLLDKDKSMIGQVVDWIVRFLKAVKDFIWRLFGHKPGVGEGPMTTAPAIEETAPAGQLEGGPAVATFVERGERTPIHGDAGPGAGADASVAWSPLGETAARESGAPPDVVRRAAEEVAQRWPALGAEMLKNPEILSKAKALMAKDGGPDRAGEYLMRLAMEHDQEAQAQALISQLEQKLKEAGISDHNNGLGLSRRDLARMMIFGMEEPGTRQALMPQAKQIVEAFLKEPQAIQQLAANLAVRAGKLGIQDVAPSLERPPEDAPAKPKGLKFGPPTARPAGGAIEDPDDVYLANRDRPAQ